MKNFATYLNLLFPTIECKIQKDSNLIFLGSSPPPTTHNKSSSFNMRISSYICLITFFDMCTWLILVFVTCIRWFGINFILIITTQWNYRLPKFRYDCGKLRIFGQIQIFRWLITLKIKYICSFVAKGTIKRVKILFGFGSSRFQIPTPTLIILIGSFRVVLQLLQENLGYHIALNYDHSLQFVSNLLSSNIPLILRPFKSC